MRNILSQIQFFHGMTESEMDDFLKIAQEHTTKYKKTLPVAYQGEPCPMMMMLVKGQLQRSVLARNGEYRLIETLSPPWIIEPELLFGENRRFSASYTLLGDSRLVAVSREEAILYVNNHPQFRLYFLKYMSTRMRKLTDNRARGFMPYNPQRAAAFVQSIAIFHKGEKWLRIGMEELSNHVGGNRLSMSRMLNKWEQDGLVQLQRKEIYIPDLEKLVEASLKYTKE